MSERTRPLSLETELRRVASSPFLLGLDFDGTLAPLVDHPDLAVPDARAMEILTSLAAGDRAEVAIVSGRGLADLRARVGELPLATLIGEHGNDIGEIVEDSDALHDVRAYVAWLEQQWPGTTVERKQRSVTFHTRGLDRAARTSAQRAIREWAAGREGVTLIEGKEVFELTTGTRDKGDAILELADGRPVIFIGDDTTDERVFEVLGPRDVGVKVGEGLTAADHRVEDVAGVVRILEVIALASS